ncbi:zinc-ribbon domain containing protein [Heyndrickxia camelliae]|nr:zinc-ribbon domain containing protein [Heyndrickxia camelliae]
MSYENVKLWFAKDENNEIITIDTVNELNKQNTYHCPVCGSDLKPKAIESKRIAPHFAHVDASKCNSESQIHFWFKNKFLEKGDKFTVVSDTEKEYICKDILVEQSYETESGLYRPDVTVVTECGNTIYFEMAFTNKKHVKDYLDKWLELKNIVVEVDIKQLALNDKLPTFKALFYDGKCFNVKKGDAYYNTIGKYKEEKLLGNVDEDLKKRIQKLDWFWDDIFRYQKGEVEIEYMVNLIDNINIFDIEIVKTILIKSNCSLSWDDYINYKTDLKLKETSDYFNKININYLYHIKIEKIIKWNKVLDVVFVFQNQYKNNMNFSLSLRNMSINRIIKELDKKTGGIDNFKKLVLELEEKYDFSTQYLYKKGICNFFTLHKGIDDELYGYLNFEYVGKYKIGKTTFTLKTSLSKDDICEIINNKQRKMIERIKRVYRWHTAKNNNILDDAIIFLNDKYKKNDDKFHFRLNREVYDNKYVPVLTFSYDFCTLKQIKLNDEIIGTSVINTILNFVNNSLNKEFLGESCLIDEPKILSAIKTLKNKHENLGISCLRGFSSFNRTNIILYSTYKQYKDLCLTIDKESYSKMLYSNNTCNNVEKIIENEVFNCIRQKHLNKYNRCTECESLLRIDNGEIKFYVEKGFELPKRCKSCRNKRKLNK